MSSNGMDYYFHSSYSAFQNLKNNKASESVTLGPVSSFDPNDEQNNIRSRVHSGMHWILNVLPTTIYLNISKHLKSLVLFFFLNLNTNNRKKEYT